MNMMMLGCELNLSRGGKTTPYYSKGNGRRLSRLSARRARRRRRRRLLACGRSDMEHAITIDPHRLPAVSVFVLASPMQSADRTNKEDAEKDEPISDRTEEKTSQSAARNATASAARPLLYTTRSISTWQFYRAAQRNDRFDRRRRKRNTKKR